MFPWNSLTLAKVSSAFYLVSKLKKTRSKGKESVAAGAVPDLLSLVELRQDVVSYICCEIVLRMLMKESKLISPSCEACFLKI
jgi:hypothetical protein